MQSHGEWEPNVQAVRALVAVAQEHSISRAGARLGISQQAVSARITSFEQETGVHLLARSPRGSILTPEGELIVGWATTLLDAVMSFADAVTTLRADRGRTLAIGASLTVAEHLVPSWIAAWREASPEDAPVARLMAANSAAVLGAVRSGEVELGFIESPVAPSDLGSVVVARDEIEILVAPDHPWATLPFVAPADIATTPLVLREEGSGTRQSLEDALSNTGYALSCKPAAVESSTLGVRSAVMAGVGPGALSSLAVADDVQHGRLVRVRIGGLAIVRPLTAIWRGRHPAPGVRAFLEAVSSAQGS